MKAHWIRFAALLFAASWMAVISGPAARAQSNPDSASPSKAAAAQAPDDATRRLSDLVHAGRYAEARQTVAALLLLYPGDQRLVKAKALLDQAVPSQPSPALVAGNAPAGAGPVPANTVKSAADSLAGMDKVDYNALLELARSAQQTADVQQQRASLQKFLDQSAPFLQKHPEQTLLWQLRGTVAVSLDSPKVGREAGLKLIEMGGADSNDPALQGLLAQLKNKGWLDANPAGLEAQEQVADKLAWLAGTWEVTWSWSAKSKFEGQHSRGGEVFVISGAEMDGFGTRSAGLRAANADLRARVVNGQVVWECYLPPSDTEDIFVYRSHWPLGSSGFYTIGRTVDGDWEKKRTFYPNGWTPVVSQTVGAGQRTMTIVIPSQNLNSNPDKHQKDPVTLTLTKVSDTQN